MASFNIITQWLPVNIVIKVGPPEKGK